MSQHPGIAATRGEKTILIVQIISRGVIPKIKRAGQPRRAPSAKRQALLWPHYTVIKKFMLVSTLAETESHGGRGAVIAPTAGISDLVVERLNG
ncbi:hypothetical protein [Candidatus Sodalis pierantonius]|uniref:hypothetical protein n=1 Tax=Candidatus Sodalis pierantonii TaxID=1486991 RepID=UPI00138B0140|nr:hypothetical protein [Candidatus Sodalis pierantonius]